MSFIPTYLYIKRHNQTGLMYFGKTIRNPLEYKGSGVYWQRHLKTHGNDVTTIYHELFSNPEDLTEFATFFSEINNIKSSKQWANLIPENGFIGGDCRTGLTHSDETRKILSEKAKDRTEQWRLEHSKTMSGRKHSAERKEKWAGLFKGEKNGMYGRTHSDEAKAKMSAARKLRAAKAKENKN